MKFEQKQYKTNLQVGIFVILALIIVVFAYLWLTNYLEKGSLSRITVSFPDATGLELGDGVLIMGVNRGKVSAIDLAGNRVIVTMNVALDEPLMDGTEFIIRNTSLMGSTRVIIKPGSGHKPLDLKQEFTGISASGITAMASQAGSVIDEFHALLSELSESDNIVSKYAQVADSLKLTLSNINKMIDQNNESVSQSALQLEKFTTDIAQLISSNRSAIDSTLAGSNELAASLRQTSDSLQVLSGEFSLVARQLQDENSTFGELTTDNKLYKNLLDTTARLDSLLADIKKNPKRYFTVEVF